MRLVSGGTDNHMVLVDLTKTGVTGWDAQQALEAVGIVANRNVIPFDPQPPKVASGYEVRHTGGDYAGHGQGRNARPLRAGL